VKKQKKVTDVDLERLTEGNANAPLPFGGKGKLIL
jgi:hypothetical protein